MPQTILIKRSAVAGKAPLPADLQLGEIAVNTRDGKLFMKTSDGSTEAIKEIGADPFPVQAGAAGQLLRSDGASVYWSSEGGTTKRIVQNSHGFSTGALIRHSGTQYVLASAASSSEAEVVGMVTAVVDINTVEITTSGMVEFASPWTLATTFTPGTAYFLSPTVPGAMTPTEPTTPGQVNKPLFIATSAHGGLFYNWRGVDVLPPVDIDNILPAQAGNAGNVLVTDGTSAGWMSVAAATSANVVNLSNTFTIGNIVRATNNPAAPFALAQANNAVNTQVYGIISDASPTSYTVTTAGRVTGLTGLTAGAVYYLSDTTAGLMTTTEPTTLSSFSKPVFIATSATDGVFFNQRGIVVGVATAAPTQILPSLTGNTGRWLTNDGVNPQWSSPFPSLVSGQFLTNNGTTLSWASVPTTAAAINTLLGPTAVQNATNASYATSSGSASTLSGYSANVNAVANTIALRDGSAGLWATVFHGTATQANYADLAENYVADAPYPVGTVLSIGGQHEVTLSTSDMDATAVGVVSDHPAHLMNAVCSGEHVVPLALTGRTPVRVTGPVQKGDMLVSNGDGTARAESNPRVGTVIGKALEPFTGIKGVIEALVGKH